MKNNVTIMMNIIKPPVMLSLFIAFCTIYIVPKFVIEKNNKNIIDYVNDLFPKYNSSYLVSNLIEVKEISKKIEMILEHLEFRNPQPNLLVINLFYS